MLGVDLFTLNNRLYKVPAHKSSCPVDSIRDFSSKAVGWDRYVELKDGGLISSLEYYRVPFEYFELFSFDELCKFRYSSVIMMHGTVYKLFEEDIQYEIVRKIISSFWRWSSSKGTWNEIVDVHNSLRFFSSGISSEFEIRLDYTTYYNERGFSKFTRTFLDGVFGILVYYKGIHVLTIGFSVLSRKRILIQQIQTKKRKGNRFLYYLPRNLVEFTIDLFVRNFPGYCIYVVNGESLVNNILNDYKEALNNLNEEGERSVWETEAYLSCCAKIKHLESDRERIIAFYKNTGKCQISDSCNFGKGLYHQVILQ